MATAMRDYAAAPTPLPADQGTAWSRGLWGAAQIGLGVRMLISHPQLWRRAAMPMLAVLVVALASAAASLEAGLGVAAARGYGILVGATTVPAFLFANTYARMAADAHQLLGLGPAEPHLTTLRRRASQLARFALVTVIPTLPLVLLTQEVPVVGHALGLGVGAVWALYLGMVEELDNARVLRAAGPGAAVPHPEATAHPPELPLPWFVAWTQSPKLPGPVRRLAARFGRVCARLARPWVEEIELTRRYPLPSVGFGSAVALLLAIPVVNLIVRPAAIIGAVHLRARTEALTAPTPSS
jgi:Etoposide-induced protein 2.4 (EI24)